MLLPSGTAKKERQVGRKRGRGGAGRQQERREIGGERKLEEKGQSGWGSSARWRLGKEDESECGRRETGRGGKETGLTGPNRVFQGPGEALKGRCGRVDPPSIQ